MTESVQEWQCGYGSTTAFKSCTGDLSARSHVEKSSAIVDDPSCIVAGWRSHLSYK
jgi:hypothetical protein